MPSTLAERRLRTRRSDAGTQQRLSHEAYVRHANAIALPAARYHDTDSGFLCPLPLPDFLEEDKGPDHDVLAASGVGGCGRIDTGCMERPARRSRQSQSHST
jgi:hypothetical protein